LTNLNDLPRQHRHSERAESLCADIPPDLTAADDILSRYGKWATSGGRSAATSVLGRLYIREADPKESLEAYIRRRSQVPSSGGMSVVEALAAQRALARVPELERTVLVILYVPHRIPTAVRLRIAKIPPRLSRERHLHGLRMFNNLHKQVTAELL
jgi:hypothetical protein